MNILLEKSACYGINERFFDEDYTLGILEAAGVTVKFNQDFTAYLTIDGKPYIAIKKGLKGLKKLFAILHEFGHHLLDCGNEPNQIHFFGGGDEKAEFQADCFATIAMLPAKGLNDHQFLEDHPVKFARQIYENRQKLDFLYGV